MTFRISPPHVHFDKYDCNRFPHVDEDEYYRIMQIYQRQRTESPYISCRLPLSLQYPGQYPSPLDREKYLVSSQTISNSVVSQDSIPKIQRWGDDVKLPPNYSTSTQLPFEIPDICKTTDIKYEHVNRSFMISNVKWVIKNYKIFPCCCIVDEKVSAKHEFCCWTFDEWCHWHVDLEEYMTLKQKELLVQILNGRPKEIQLHLIGRLNGNLKKLHYVIKNTPESDLEIVYGKFLSSTNSNWGYIKDEDVPTYPLADTFRSFFARRVRELDNFNRLQRCIVNNNLTTIPLQNDIRYWGDDIELPPDHYREIYFKIPECCQVHFKKLSSDFLSQNTDWAKKNYKIFPCLYIGQRGHMECGLNTNEWCFHYQHLEDYITFKQKELLVSILKGKTKNIQLHLLGKMACYLPKLRYMIDKTPKDQLDKVYQKFILLPARYAHFNTTRGIDVPTYPFADTYVSFFAVRIKELENYQKLRFSPQGFPKSEILETYEKVSSWFKERLDGIIDNMSK